MKRYTSTLLVLAAAISAAADQKISAPRVWTDKDLADWATPTAGLNVRPGHFSEREYYAAPEAEWVRTYPVYFPGKEPAGYAQFLASRKAKPLILPRARTTRDWVKAGQVVFREIDVPATRNYDPELIAMARSAEALTKAGVKPQSDGSIAGLRWAPTAQGLALSVEDCGGCHTRVLDDGTRIDGAPLSGSGNAVLGKLVSRAVARFYGDTPADWTWRSSAVPWLADDVHSNIRTLSPQEYRGLFRRVVPGTFARFNGSPLFPTKVPDLIGVGERRYIDHTATHQLRGMGDLMRYAALVGCCDSGEFGSHKVFGTEQRRIRDRYSDDVLFALAQYIYSLKPPVNPYRNNALIPSGQSVFAREGCGRCHTAPLYTNNKLTLADQYQPPSGHPYASDILTVSVGTDPGLALKTRKGTGFYKVPSLKGLWYRGRYNHDGSVDSLEQWFNPERLETVKGHPFGLNLSVDEKAALLAFLRSL